MTPGAGSALNYGFDASGNLTTLPTGASGSYDNASELTASSPRRHDHQLHLRRRRRTHPSKPRRHHHRSATYNGAQELTTYNNTAANMTAASYDGDGLRASHHHHPTGGSRNHPELHLGHQQPLPQLLMDSTNAYIYGTGNTPIEQVNLTTGTITYLVSRPPRLRPRHRQHQRHPHRHHQLRRLGQPRNHRRPHHQHPLRLRRQLHRPNRPHLPHPPLLRPGHRPIRQRRPPDRPDRSAVRICERRPSRRRRPARTLGLEPDRRRRKRMERRESRQHLERLLRHRVLWRDRRDDSST